jgi:type VI secretion system protein ImpG
MLPALLHSGDISVAVDKNPAVASFSNVTRPTRPLWPVTDGGMHWSLISSMNLNYLSLLDREALIQVMRTLICRDSSSAAGSPFQPEAGRN